MADLQKWAEPVEVFLNGIPIKYLQPLEIGRSTLGKSLDYAELLIQSFPQQSETFLMEDIRLVDDLENQRRCTIHITDEAGNRQLIHYGVIDAKSISIDRSERQTIMSRLQPHHFGEPIRGMRVANRFTGGVSDSLEPIVFNPQLDGRVANNCSLTTEAPADSNLFLHPECQRTPFAMLANGAKAVEGWSLFTACRYLCWAGNRAQTFITNPTNDELLVLSPDTTILRNHQQPFGEYLPANLDALLEPYGYGWYIDLSENFPRIRVFRRGAGEPIAAKLQPRGDSIDLDKSNAEETGVTTDVSNRLANFVEIYGDYVIVEGSWELAPGWNPKYDALVVADPTKLDLHGGYFKYWDSDPALARVWRDWVLNEDGSYTGLRADPRLTEPYNFNAAAGIPNLVFHARRRRFLPCITFGDDLRPIGEHHGCVIEYFRYDRNPKSTNLLPTGSWQPIEQLSSGDTCSIQILDKECGIRFGGLHVPPDLVEYGVARARIRVTAAVEMDTRVYATAIAVTSPNAHRVFRVVDVGSRFKDRGVLAMSKFIDRAAVSSTAVNDVPKARALAAELLANWNQASISGTIALPGVDWEHGSICLGRPLSGIDGRDISFQTTKAGPAKFPTVTALKYDFQNQKTIVTLDTWRRDNV